VKEAGEKDRSDDRIEYKRQKYTGKKTSLKKKRRNLDQRALKYCIRKQYRDPRRSLLKSIEL
jgi:hypothetical protein